MKKYTKEDIINLFNRNISKGLLSTNGTVDQLLGFLDYEEKELEVSDFILDINHSEFENLLAMGFDFFELFNVSTMSELTTNIIDISNKYSDYGYIETEDLDNSGSNKMKGDLFEIFAEIFFKLTSSDNRVGVTDYNPVGSNDDYGVDGTGIDIHGLNTTIQVKFRSNVTTELKIKDLHNFHGISYKHYGVPVEGGKIIVFTNCKGLHWNTETNVLKNSTITYGVYDESNDYNLQKLVDNNTSFWKNLNKMIQYNIDELMK